MKSKKQKTTLGWVCMDVRLGQGAQVPKPKGKQSENRCGSAWRKIAELILQVDMKQSDTEFKREKNTTNLGNRDSSS